jgi:hypothetical protein
LVVEKRKKRRRGADLGFCRRWHRRILAGKIAKRVLWGEKIWVFVGR